MTATLDITPPAVDQLRARSAADAAAEMTRRAQLPDALPGDWPLLALEDSQQRDPEQDWCWWCDNPAGSDEDLYRVTNTAEFQGDPGADQDDYVHPACVPQLLARLHATVLRRQARELARAHDQLVATCYGPDGQLEPTDDQHERMDRSAREVAAQVTALLDAIEADR